MCMGLRSGKRLSRSSRDSIHTDSPDAVMSHTISLDDQYASYDSGITQFNFLRFPDWAWRCLNNPIIPLNRLRISDYRRFFSESGFQVVDETSQRGDVTYVARENETCFCRSAVLVVLPHSTSMVPF